MFYCEKSLRTNEAGLTDLALFTIAVIQRNGESVPVCAAGDLAKNQSAPGRSAMTRAGRRFPPAESDGGNGMATISPATGLTMRHPLLVSSNRVPEPIRSFPHR